MAPYHANILSVRHDKSKVFSNNITINLTVKLSLSSKALIVSGAWTLVVWNNISSKNDIHIPLEYKDLVVIMLSDVKYSS